MLTIGGTPGNPTFFIDGFQVAGPLPNDAVNSGILASSVFTKHDAGHADHFLTARTNGGYVAVGGSEFGAPGAVFTSAILGRTAPTQLITTASAQYEGDYAGLVTERGAPAPAILDDVDYLISGDASLTANFDSSIISGIITNRVVSAATTGAVLTNPITSDVTLVSSIIGADGVFSGTAAGGQISDVVNTNGNGAGSYTGAFVGPYSDAVIGSVTLPVNAGSHFPQDGGLEIGAFVADKQ